MNNFSVEHVPTGLPPGVIADGWSRLLAPLDLLDPFPHNPRNEEDFDPARNAGFKDLKLSIDHVGVREPIPVYPRGGRCAMKAGHRRREAVIQINQDRKRAYEARRALPPSDPRYLSSEDPVPEELQLITHVPIVLVNPPTTVFEQVQDMWLSESQRQKWPVNKLVPFYRQTWEAAPESLRDDPKAMAGKLGLPVSRVKLLNTIITSPVLFNAAIAPTEVTKLSLPGREKTLRSVNRAAEVISSERPAVALRITGIPEDGEARWEAVRKRLVDKAGQMEHPGVTLEDIAPRLRPEHPSTWDDDTLVTWLTLPGDLPPRVVNVTPPPAPTPATPTTSAEEGTSCQETVASGFVDLMVSFKAMDLNSLSDADLGDLVAVWDQGISDLEALVIKARKVRRSRIA